MDSRWNPWNESMESRWNDPWNEYGIQIGLSEISDKVPFHVESME